jgi:hypothetical protein
MTITVRLSFLLEPAPSSPAHQDPPALESTVGLTKPGATRPPDPRPDRPSWRQHLLPFAEDGAGA